MKGINVENLTRVCAGTYYGPEELRSTEMVSISTDSRQIEEGALFVPIRGERADGHKFIPDVFEKGAVLTLSEERLDGTYPYILVASSLQALKDIATFYLAQLDVKVVGITGSVGKTSTKEMIASVLEQKYVTLKTLGNFNNEIGLPLTVFRLREEHQAAVLEMGISDFGEMSRLTAIAKPDIAVITNIGWCHLENLQSRDGILKAKTEIFKGLKADGAIVLNGEDDKLCTITEYQGIQPVFFGYGQSCQIYASQVENKGLQGTTCSIHTPQGTFQTQIHIPGVHMVLNAMAATAVGLQLGLTLEEIKAGIEKLQPVRGRTNLILGEQYTIIDDCYNANPVSMKASIDVLMQADGRKVCVLGDMFELGKEEKALHGEVGSYIAAKDVDVLITIGTLSEQIYQQAKKNTACLCRHFQEKEKAVTYLMDCIEKGDTILVKASHGMAFTEIVDRLNLHKDE